MIDYVYCVAFSNDSSKMATCGLDGIVNIINVKTFEIIHTLERIHQGDVVFCVTFSMDGKLLATGGEDLSIKLIDVETAYLVYSFENAHNSNFSPRDIDSSMLSEHR